MAKTTKPTKEVRRRIEMKVLDLRLETALSNLDFERDRRKRAEEERDRAARVLSVTISDIHKEAVELAAKLLQAEARAQGSDRLCSILAVALEHYQKVAKEIE
jgi:hypothetical protein